MDVSSVDDMVAVWAQFPGAPGVLPPADALNQLLSVLDPEYRVDS